MTRQTADDLAKRVNDNVMPDEPTGIICRSGPECWRPGPCESAGRCRDGHLWSCAWCADEGCWRCEMGLPESTWVSL